MANAQDSSSVGFAIVAFIVACLLFSWPLALVGLFFVLLIAIAAGVWNLVNRLPPT